MVSSVVFPRGAVETASVRQGKTLRPVRKTVKANAPLVVLDVLTANCSGVRPMVFWKSRLTVQPPTLVWKLRMVLHPVKVDASLAQRVVVMDFYNAALPVAYTKAQRHVAMRSCVVKMVTQHSVWQQPVVIA